MIEFLDHVALLSAWFMALPRGVMLLSYGLLLTYSIAAGGYVLARTGIKPLWVLLLLVPTLNLVGLYVWAIMRWPTLKRKETAL